MLQASHGTRTPTTVGGGHQGDAFNPDAEAAPAPLRPSSHSASAPAMPIAAVGTRPFARGSRQPGPKARSAKHRDSAQSRSAPALWLPGPADRRGSTYARVRIKRADTTPASPPRPDTRSATQRTGPQGHRRRNQDNVPRDVSPSEWGLRGGSASLLADRGKRRSLRGSVPHACVRRSRGRNRGRHRQAGAGRASAGSARARARRALVRHPRPSAAPPARPGPRTGPPVLAEVGPRPASSRAGETRTRVGWRTGAG